MQDMFSGPIQTLELLLIAGGIVATFPDRGEQELRRRKAVILVLILNGGLFQFVGQISSHQIFGEFLFGANLIVIGSFAGFQFWRRRKREVKQGSSNC